MYVCFKMSRYIKKNCCVCLCVYNNENGLPQVLNNIKKLDSILDTKILVFYDHSNDRSLQILSEFNNENVNKIEIIINERKLFNERVENISYARNGLLQLIRDKYSHYEYFIMMDCNEYACVGEIIVNNIKKVLMTNDWDSISFDRVAGYYDYWALSYDPYVYSFFHFNCHDYEKIVSVTRSNFQILLNDYKTTKPGELIPVYSAFNGFAIYRTAKFLNCNYSTVIDISLFPEYSIENNEMMTGYKTQLDVYNCDCEHRHFHLEAIKKNNARIRVSTKHIFKKVLNPEQNLRGPC